MASRRASEAQRPGSSGPFSIGHGGAWTAEVFGNRTDLLDFGYHSGCGFCGYFASYGFADPVGCVETPAKSCADGCCDVEIGWDYGCLAESASHAS